MEIDDIFGVMIRAMKAYHRIDFIREEKD